MPYGLYISAEGASAQARRIEAISHNLANVDTVGFQRELAVLQARHAEAIEQGQDTAGSRSINDVGGGVTVRQTLTEWGGGPIRATGVPTDVAIEGQGFFVVVKDGAQLLTRAGNFRFSPEGQLVTQQGYPVLADDGQSIAIDPSLPWRMLPDGTLSQGGSNVALALVKPASLGDLVRVGENLFSPLAPAQPLPAAQRGVQSGYLEYSGVRPTLETMDLIEASRALEANVRMIQNQDQMIGALVNRVLRQS